jgi:uncharacterized protein (TIGR00369 family)
MPYSSCVPPNPNFIEVTKRFLMAMPIAQHMGFDITDVAPGRFEITQAFRREFSFREGVFQAGAIGTLADMAAACAGATMLPDGWAASTVDYTLKLLVPAVGEKLVARGRVLRSGRTLSVAAADVFSVRNGEETLCATALTTIRNFETQSSDRQ